MFCVFVIGNIASGKSTAARYLESRGARRIDLDQMAKDLYYPGSPVVSELADAFGCSVLAADGGIDVAALARVAFADEVSASRLNSIVHPALRERLGAMLVEPVTCAPDSSGCVLTVVEVSVAASFTDAFDLADEVICITAPLDVRRVRALERGMSGGDFDRRAAAQPSEEELQRLATLVIDNSCADEGLFRALDAWLESRGLLLAASRGFRGLRGPCLMGDGSDE